MDWQHAANRSASLTGGRTDCTLHCLHTWSRTTPAPAPLPTACGVCDRPAWRNTTFNKSAHLRPAPRQHRLPWLVRTVHGQLHLPALRVVLEHGLQRGSVVRVSVVDRNGEPGEVATGCTCRPWAWPAEVESRRKNGGCCTLPGLYQNSSSISRLAGQEPSTPQPNDLRLARQAQTNQPWMCCCKSAAAGPAAPVQSGGCGGRSQQCTYCFRPPRLSASRAHSVSPSRAGSSTACAARRVRQLPASSPTNRAFQATAAGAQPPHPSGTPSRCTTDDWTAVNACTQRGGAGTSLMGQTVGQRTIISYTTCAGVRV